MIATPAAWAWTGWWKLTGSPVDPDLAAVGRVHAGEDLHERRLAGAVLPHDRVDLARVAVEPDAVEHLDAEEALADVAHLQQRRHQTSTQAPELAEASTASISRALRAPSANVGNPSGASPAIAA